MKKTFIPAALLCLALCAALLIGCTPASQPQTHTISFYAEGERVAVLETAGNETLALPEAPQKSGSVFSGWFLGEGEDAQQLLSDTFASKPLTEDLSAYALYTAEETPDPDPDPDPDPEPEKHTITFRADGAVVGTVQTAGNEEITLPAAPGKEGHTFAGWYFDEGVWERRLKEDTYLHTALTEDADVYAKYDRLPDPEPEKFTVTFDTRGGSDIAPAELSSVADAGSLPVPVRAGFTFTGWFLDENCETPVPYPYTVESDVTFYAGWESEGIRFLVGADGALTGVEGAEGAFSLEIPEKVGNVTVTSIAGGAFSGTGIVSVRIPATVRSIGGESFMNCKDLSTVVFEEGVTTIQESAFEGCVSLKKIVFPDSLLQIRSDAFSGSGLTGLSLNKVREVWQYAFKNCAALVSLDLGGGARDRRKRL